MYASFWKIIEIKAIFKNFMENKDSESKFLKNSSLRKKLYPTENANSQRVTNKSLLQFSYQMLSSLQSDENSSSEN